MNLTKSFDGKEQLRQIIQFIRKKYVIVFLFNFLLRLIIDIPLYLQDKDFAHVDQFAEIAMTWYVGLKLHYARQFIFMPLLIQIFSLNFIINPYITWLMIDIAGYSVGFAVVFHLFDTRLKEWEINKPNNFLELYILSNLLFPVTYLSRIQTFGLLLMLVSLTIFFVYEDKLHFSIVFAILSALTHFYGWAFISILILYAYKDRRYLIYIIPSFFVLLQFFFFYIRTGDFFLFFHAQQANWEHYGFTSDVPFSYPFSVMVRYWGNINTNLHRTIALYITYITSIVVIISSLYFYIKNNHLNRLNLIFLLYFILIQIVAPPRLPAVNRYLGLMLPFCTILLIIRFAEDVNIEKLRILIAVLFIVNVVIIWHLWLLTQF